MTTQQEVLNFIQMLLGSKTLTEIENDGKEITVASGPFWMNLKLFMKGDCGRFAKILSLHFADLNPTIYRIRFPIWKANDYHYIVKIEDNYYDAAGTFDESRLTPDIEVEMIDTPELVVSHKHEFIGNFTLARMFGEMMRCTIPMFQYTLDMKDVNHPRIKGGYIDEVMLACRIYEDIWHSAELSVIEMIEKAEKCLEKAKFGFQFQQSITLGV